MPSFPWNESRPANLIQRRVYFLSRSSPWSANPTFRIKLPATVSPVALPPIACEVGVERRGSVQKKLDQPLRLLIPSEILDDLHGIADSSPFFFHRYCRN